MNPAVDGFHLAGCPPGRPRPLTSAGGFSELGRVLTLIYRLAPRGEQEGCYGVERVDDHLALRANFACKISTIPIVIVFTRSVHD